MYCANCGMEIKEDMQFCPSCGAKADVLRSEKALAIVNANVAENMMINITPITQATVNAIYNLLDPLKRISEENAIIDKIQKGIDVNKKKAENIPLNIILGLVIGMFAGNIILYFFVRSDVSRLFWGGLIGSFIGYLTLCGSKKALRVGESRKEEHLNRISDICEEIDPNAISLLPPSYRFYNAATFFYHAFVNQRAYTMQQAVNLYEDESRKDQMAMLQKQQMAQLNSIRKSSQVSATLHTLEFIGRLF